MSENVAKCLHRKVNGCVVSSKGNIGRASKGEEGSLEVKFKQDSTEIEDARGRSI